MKTTEILRKMRETLETEGWIQDALIRRFPVMIHYADRSEAVIRPVGMCSQGACLAAMGCDWMAVDAGDQIDRLERDSLPVAAILTRVIAEQYPERGHGYYADSWDTVIGFNDDKRTTLEDVYLVIDKAIAQET